MIVLLLSLPTHFVLLQVTALLFLPATVLAAVAGRWLGATAIGATTVTSLWVHRPARGEAWDFLDYVDVGALTLWVLYNTFVVVQVSICLNETFSTTTFVNLMLSLSGAVGSAYFERMRQYDYMVSLDAAMIAAGKIEWRSPSNVERHAGLHFCGGIGSIFLVMAAMDTDKTCSHPL